MTLNDIIHCSYLQGAVMSHRCIYTIVIALLAFVMFALFQAETTCTGEDWSQELNGLQARLSMRQRCICNGTAIINTYLEIKNVSDSASPIIIAVDEKKMAFRVTGADGYEVSRHHGIFDGYLVPTPELVLPVDSIIRFRIGSPGYGIPSDQAAIVDLGARDAWVLPRDGKSYFLQCVLEIERDSNRPREPGTRRWHGRLDLPKVRIPTGP